MDALTPYRWVWAVDFEFTAPPGERPVPLCCVARELRTGRLERLWLADGAPDVPPYGIGPENLFLSYYASAELSCHLSLGWPMPARILDLYAEFRRRTSGLSVPCGNGLLGALAYFGLDGLAAAEKDTMRQLAIRGGCYTPAERQALLDYCQSDTDALARLLPAMLPVIDLPRALLRGRYLAAVARMEWEGVPLDTETFGRLRDGWEDIKGRLIATVDRDFGVFIPVGQRTLHPESPLGAAILREAAQCGIAPYRLADAVESVWIEEKESTAAIYAARRAARQVTGLTTKRINQWEDAGRDYSEFPGLDVMARELAGAYPALGIPNGIHVGDGVDNTDYAALLWEQLREREEKCKPKHHPEILRRAAERIAGCPDEEPYPVAPQTFSVERWAAYLERFTNPYDIHNA